MKILALDPGSAKGAVVLWDVIENRVLESFEADNANLLTMLVEQTKAANIYCEKLECFGLPVGAAVFETAYWIGRAMQVVLSRGQSFTLVSRRAVKLHFCNSARAKDGNVAQALRDRLGGKGVKSNPGPLFGVSGHQWQALAIAVFAADNFVKAFDKLQ